MKSKKEKLTQERLKKLLDYDPGTGIFTWNINRGGTAIAGSIAGHNEKRGYVMISVDNRSYRAHRLAWLYIYGYLPEYQIDHKDRDKTDTRISKLREASPQCNSRNSGNRIDNTSGIKGVYWDTINKKWKAQISVNGKVISAGRFDDFYDAVCSRLAYEQCLNWAGCDSLSPAYKYVSKNITNKCGLL